MQLILNDTVHEAIIVNQSFMHVQIPAVAYWKHATYLPIIAVIKWIACKMIRYSCYKIVMHIEMKLARWYYTSVIQQPTHCISPSRVLHAQIWLFRQLLVMILNLCLPTLGANEPVEEPNSIGYSTANLQMKEIYIHMHQQERLWMLSYSVIMQQEIVQYAHIHHNNIIL